MGEDFKCRTGDLFFFVFGIDQNADEETKKSRCSEKAYLDLCRTIDYRLNSEKCKKDKKFTNEKNKFKEEVNKIIIESIDEYSKTTPFSDWHEELFKGVNRICDKYKEIFRDKENLTVGHIQKWINMTIKYEWIMGVIPKEMLDVVHDIHIPIDGYIIAAASKRENEIICEGYDVTGLGISKPKWNWSNLKEYEVYKTYQDSLREKIKIAPIEWESLAWRAEALSRDKG